MQNELKNSIRIFRAKEKVLQKDLAEACDVRRVTIHAIETGHLVPSTILALKIVRFFNVSVDEIFWLEEEISNIDLIEEQPHRDPNN